MKTAILGGMALLLVLSGTALADGVPLITSAAPLAASDPVRANWPPEAYRALVKVHPINLNRSAFGLPIVTVVIEGKVHTYRGSMVSLPANPAKVAGRDESGAMVSVVPPRYEAWVGYEDDKQGMLYLSKMEGHISGSIFMPPNSAFSLETRNGRTFLLEGDATKARDIPPPHSQCSASATTLPGCPSGARK